MSKESKNALKKEAQKMRNEPPRRSVLEEVGNAVTHGVGALLSVAGLVLLLLRSDTPVKLTASLIYGICLIILFLMSCLYHSFPAGSGVKRLWRRFDYIAIYLLIGGTFAPLLLVFQGGAWGWALFALQWAVIITGIVFIGVYGPGRLKKTHTALYILLGWCGLLFFPAMVKGHVPLLLMILGGGLLYTLGIIPFALKKKGAHFICYLRCVYFYNRLNA